MYKRIGILFTIICILGGCSKMLSPENDNHRTLTGIYSDPAFAEGVLLNAYSRIPTNNWSFNDVSTDDAVSNDKNNTFLQMATGQWSSINNPMDQWTNAYTAIMYLNEFLSNVDSINWSPMGDNDIRILFHDRMKGEAFGLRALFMFYLLQAHGGIGTDGTLLGVPIINDMLTPGSDFKTPRNTFDECMSQLYTDLDSCEFYLPLDYVDIAGNAQVPAKYNGMTYDEYNRVFGSVNNQRMDTRIAKAVRAKAALLAASPVFNPNSDVNKWIAAANDADSVLSLIGGIAGMDPQGGLFYTPQNADAINLANGVEQKEMLWRSAIATNNNLEQDNLPPTLYGNGRLDPSQNLVDAFPMANGYPITDNVNSGYQASNPYAGRDPRLAEYVILNGSSFAGQTILTQTGGGNDAVNVLPTSTRSGYYMRKLLREDVNLNPNTMSSQKHYVPHIRYTEIFLSYAEAANEAWGPDGDGGHGYTARNVIAAIRQRAGITQPDNYLSSITTQPDMRTLIHNERRLELCFEGFRFWDLRRWKETINNPVNGVVISANTYKVQQIENRAYQDYMYYGPIPYKEVANDKLIQNKGW